MKILLETKKFISYPFREGFGYYGDGDRYGIGFDSGRGFGVGNGISWEYAKYGCGFSNGSSRFHKKLVNKDFQK